MNPNSNQKILIVDDNPRNLLVLEQTLSETGAQCIRAANGQEALRLSLDHEFALAILDVQMPGMNGFELAAFLRNDNKTRHLPVIFLSAAFTELQDFFTGYKTGAVDYLVKPFQPEILLGKVTVFLELDQQRKTLDIQRRMLEDANRELEAFSYSVSHDLRAPLRTVIAFSKIISEDFGEDLPEEAASHLQRVQNAAQRMDLLIQDLLELSRVTRKALLKKDVNLSALAADVSAELQKQPHSRTVDFVIADELIAPGDPTLLKVVLENLIGNAWKYTGKVQHARIEIGQEQREGLTAYFVRDNGAGFNMARAARIFDPFVRLHDSHEFEGSGIGLSTVQRIIHRHGGCIWAAAEPDKGAAFYFTLQP